MFLISLIIFPGISYFLFEKYKENIKELNGVSKLIGLIGLFLLVGFIYLEYYKNSEELLSIIIITYIITFLFFYLKIAGIQVKNTEELVNNNFTLNNLFLKIIFFGYVFIFGFYISNSVDRIFNYNDLGFFIGIFIGLTFIFSVIFQFLELLKNQVLTSKVKKNNFRLELKKELKKEILEELKI